MARKFRKTCQCCGLAYIAGHHTARWCSSRCSMRAYQRRRRGEPEADLRLLAPRVLQPTIVDAHTDLPPAGTEERFWQGTAIQRRLADRFVNGTAMCKAGGKLFADYARLARTQEYMAALANVVAEKPCGAAVAGNPITAPGLIHTIQGGVPALQGTWIHPRLAIDLARWISPAFAVWMDGWFLDSLARPNSTLSPGIHVVATSKREACQLWHQAIQSQMQECIHELLAPDDKTDWGLKLMPAPYSYISA